MPTSSWRGWAREGLKLSTRRIGENVTLALLQLATIELSGPSRAEVESVMAPAALGLLPTGAAATGALFVWPAFMPLTYLAVPLVLCERQLRPRRMLVLTVRALAQNPFVWRVSTATGMLGLVGGVWHGVAAVPFYPVVASMMYLAYRHIYLGEFPQAGVAAVATEQVHKPSIYMEFEGGQEVDCHFGELFVHQDNETYLDAHRLT